VPVCDGHLFALQPRARAHQLQSKRGGTARAVRVRRIQARRSAESGDIAPVPGVEEEKPTGASGNQATTSVAADCTGVNADGGGGPVHTLSEGLASLSAVDRAAPANTKVRSAITLYTHTLRSILLLGAHILHAYSTPILAANTLHLYSALILFTRTQHSYSTPVLYTRTLHSYSILVRCTHQQPKNQPTPPNVMPPIAPRRHSSFDSS
jgi:hypothetical protein